MTNLTVFDIRGKPVKKIAINGKEPKPNPELISQAILVEASRARVPIASTKTRGEVKGGGAKPWRQKGTGRARAGSIRSPLWRGGGIIFGPKATRTFKKSLPAKMKTKAFGLVLFNLVKNKRLFLVKNWQITEASAKTKVAQKFIEKLALGKKKVLALIPKETNLARRAFRNLPLIKIISPEAVTLRELFETPALLTDEVTFKNLEIKWLKNLS